MRIIPHRPLGTHMLTDKEVLDLRLRQRNGEDIDVMFEADKFGCSPSTIKKMLRGETYRWVGAVPREKEAPASVSSQMSPEAAAIAERIAAKGLMKGVAPSVLTAESEARAAQAKSEADLLIEEMTKQGAEERTRAVKWAKEQAALGSLVSPPPENERVGNPMEDQS